MNNFKLKKIELKLYLEGIEFPINSITINEQLGAYPQCDIAVPASSTILDILPRTLVHVFYKDSHTLDWLLIFEGEVSGISSVYTPDSRNISISCTSIANNWEYAIKTGTGLKNILLSNGATSEYIKSTFSNLEENAKIPKEVKNARELIDPDQNEKISIDLRKLLTDFSDLAVIIKNIFEDSYSDEKFSSLFSEITNLFGQINYGYLIPHVILKIAQRFSVFGNNSVKEFLASTSGQNMLQNKYSNFSEEMSLIDAINLVLHCINYNLIIPASPTIDEKTKNPQSFICMPDPYSFLPVSSNIFFKDNLIQATYNKNLLMEPTRAFGKDYMTTVYATMGGRGVTELLNNLNLIVAPSSDLVYTKINDDETLQQLSLTKKERLRGVNDILYNDDTYYNLIVIAEESADKKRESVENMYPDEENKKKREEELKKVNDELKEEKNKIQELLKLYTQNNLESFYDTGVLSTRTFSFATTYSPYRICGLPGIYIDDDMPSIFGQIGEIRSIIQAGGTATSSIRMLYPRNLKAYNEIKGNFKGISELEDYLILSGWSPDDTTNEEKLKNGWPFLKDATIILPGETKETSLGNEYSGSKKQKKAWIEHIKHKLQTEDEINFLNGWFDADRYFPNKIGKTVYKKLVYGLEKDDFNNPESKKAKFFKEATKDFNGGMGKYEDTKLPFGTGTNNSWENSNWFSYYLGKIKTIYLDKRKGNIQHEFMDKIIRRNIITEKEYWNFILGNNEINEENKIRSVMTSMSSEIKDIKDKRNNGINPLFIKERRETVSRIKKEFLVTNIKKE